MCERGRGTFTIDSGDPVHRTVDPEPPPVAAVPDAGDDGLVLLRRAGRVDPGSFDDYVASGGFEALETARRIGGEAVIDRVRSAGRRLKLGEIPAAGYTPRIRP